MDREDVPVIVHEETQPIELQTSQQFPLPYTLPHRGSHIVLGIVQMCIGSLCLIMSIVGFCIPYVYYGNYDYAGAGIYTGVFYIVAGLLGVLAFRYNSRNLVVACMVLNIVAACVTVIGLTFAGLQLSTLSYLSIFQRVKCGIIILCCSIELITTIVHASFSCASVCRCCLPQESSQGGVIRSVGAQSLPQTTIPAETCQQLPQQQPVIECQQPGSSSPQHAVHSYPEQPVENNAPDNVESKYIAQQDTGHPSYTQVWPYNASTNVPPPYSETLPIDEKGDQAMRKEAVAQQD